MQNVEQSQPTSPLVGWLLLASLVVLPSLFGTGFTRFEWLKLSTLMTIGGLASLLSIYTIVKHKNTSWRNPKGGGLLLGFGVFSILSLVWAPQWGFGLEHALSWFLFAILAFLFSTLSPKTIENIGPAIALGAIGAAGMCLMDGVGVSVFSSIWDAPGAAGPFDSTEQGAIFFLFSLSLTLVLAPSLDGMKKILTIAGVVISALAFGLLGSPNLLHALILLALAGHLWFKYREKTPLLLWGISIVMIGAGLGFAPKIDQNLTISNKVPVIYETGIKTIAEIKSPKIQNVGFDINRVPDAPFVDVVKKPVKDLFSRDFSSLLVGKGAGSWWLLQKGEFPKDEFKYYSVYRDTPGLLIFELGLMGIFFLLAFCLSFLVKIEEKMSGFIQGLPLAILVILGAAFLNLSTVVLLLACAVGIFSTKEDSLDLDQSNTTRNGVLLLLGLGGFSFLLFGAFSFQSRMKESKADLAMLRKKYNSAAQAYKDAYEVSTLEPSVAYNYALALKKIGRGEMAAEPANHALALKPDDARFVYLISQLHLTQKDEENGNRSKFRYLSESLKSSERAVSLFPNYINARKSVVLVKDLQGSKAKANQSLLDIIKLDPPDEVKQQIHYELGQSFTVLGKPKSALEHYRLSMIGETDIRRKQSISIRISQIQAKMEEERLMREGKPLPEMLKKKLQQNDHSKHGH